MRWLYVWFYMHICMATYTIVMQDADDAVLHFNTIVTSKSYRCYLVNARSATWVAITVASNYDWLLLGVLMKCHVETGPFSDVECKGS